MRIYHPSFGGEINYRADVVSDDPDEQVAQVIGLMSRYVSEDLNTPQVQRDAAEARALGAGDPVAGTFRYVKDRLRFTEDERTAIPLQPWFPYDIVETLVRPRDMSVMCEGGECEKSGDCDDFSMYTAALVMANGIPAKFITVAADPRDPRAWSHVYVAACPDDNACVPLDTSHGPYPGWQAQNPMRIKEWPISQTPGWVLWALGAVGLFLYFKRKRGVS